MAKYDDVLLPFLAMMRRELEANSSKGDRPGWLAMDPNTAMLEVYWHAAKLSAAVKNRDVQAITEHAADVANMAMMVLDVAVRIEYAAAVAGLPGHDFVAQCEAAMPCGCGPTCEDKGEGCRYIASGVAACRNAPVCKEAGECRYGCFRTHGVQEVPRG